MSIHDCGTGYSTETVRGAMSVRIPSIFLKFGFIIGTMYIAISAF